MVCLAEKIDDRTFRRGRGGVGRRDAALRQRKAANARFAVQRHPQGGNGVPAGTVKYLYYSNNWRVLEARWNGAANMDAAHQYAWSQMYIDAMVLRDTYINGAVQPDARIYTQFDANYNVTALIGYNASTNTWGVVQRYVYTPYGVATVLDANWNATTDQFAWQYMHQGGRQDPITGLYSFRHRDYSPTLGNWVEQDPAGYVNGANVYSSDSGRPAAVADPMGLWKILRNGGARAEAVTQKGDFIAALAHIIGLDRRAWRKWLTVRHALHPFAGTGRVGQFTALCPGQKVYIPNTVVADWSGELGGFGRAYVGWHGDLSTLAARGFKVAETRNPTGNRLLDMLGGYSRRRELQGFLFWGHGFPDYSGLSTEAHSAHPGRHQVFYNPGPKWGATRGITTVLRYRLGLTVLFACYTELGAVTLSSNTPGSIRWGTVGELVPLPFHFNNPAISSIIRPGEQGTRR